MRFLHFYEPDCNSKNKFNQLEGLGGCFDVNQWVGDGICDDITNIIECDYDGGDCCMSDVITEFCTECLCLPINGSTLLPVTSTGKHYN